MRTKLDRFLDTIDPSAVLDDTFGRCDDAINSFAGMPPQICEWSEFRRCLTEFCCHAENVVLGLRNPRSANLEFDWGRCVRLLLDEYGQSGEKAAFEMARTGTEGGLYAVFRTVARAIAEEYSRSEVSSRVNVFMNGLTTDEQLGVSQEYLDKFGHLLPSEMTEGSAARLRANFRSVLEEHPYLVRRLGRIGRY